MRLENRQIAAAMRQSLDQLKIAATWTPEPYQVPPPHDATWDGWLLMGGRGIGKTDTGAEYVNRHMNGPACIKRGEHPHWGAIIAPTQMDAATSCIEGPTGIKSHNPSVILVTTKEGTVARWPNGAQAKLYGTDTEKATDSLRSGGNTCIVWAEELAAWRWLDLAWAMFTFGLRAGANPRWIATTTPKPRKLIKQLDRGEIPRVVISRASTDDNPHLAESRRETYYGLYGGTDLGDQELGGRIIDQSQNALWKRDQIARFRCTEENAPREAMKRIIIGVDPSGGAGEQGIIVVGFGNFPVEGHGNELMRVAVPRGFVLADYTCTLEPDQWGDRAVQAAMDWDADTIVAESDYGRDMPLSVINGALQRAGLMIPVHPALARAIGNKRARAFPVAAKAAQGRYPHVGVHELLEDQQCTWTEAENYSPDRIDAAVWPAWKAGLVSMTFTGAGALPGREAAATQLITRRR